MLAKLNTTIIAFLIVALLATGGGFFLHSRSTKAEIAALQQQNATYSIVVDQQARTIETMQADAERIAVTTKLMHQRFIDSEAGFVADMDRIENLELGEEDGSEQRINDEFARSVEGLKQLSGKK